MIFRLLCNETTGFLIALILGNKVYDVRWSKFTFYVDRKLISGKQIASIFWGFYESAERRLIEKHLPANLDVIELGSSLGIVTSHIGSRLLPGRKLIGVEANPKLISLLNANVKKHLVNGVYFFVSNQAIDYQKSEVELSITNNNTETRVITDSQIPTGVVVRTTRVDSLMKDHHIQDYVLVCDIEGAEIGVLLNDSDALKSCSHLFIELHETYYQDKRYDVDSLVRMIVQDHRFVLFDHHGPVFYFSRTNSTT